jgi:hypothetical protein
VNRMRWSSPAGIQTQSSNTYGIASFGNDYVQDTWAVAKLSSVITSRISNELRYQWGRDNEFENNQTPSPYEQSTLVSPPGYTNPLGCRRRFRSPTASTSASRASSIAPSIRTKSATRSRTRSPGSRGNTRLSLALTITTSAMTRPTCATNTARSATAAC